MTRLSRQLISAIGLLVAIVIVAAGVFLGALPLYLGASGVQAQADAADAANTQLQQRIDALEALSADSDELNAEVADLREGVPARGDVNQIFDLITDAAASSGVTITSLSSADAAPFALRTAEVAAADAAGGVDAAAAVAPDAAASTDDATGGAQQIPLALTVQATDARQAAAFLDALRAGPRLLAIVGASATDTGGDPERPLTVTVSALSFSVPVE